MSISYYKVRALCIYMIITFFVLATAKGMYLPEQRLFIENKGQLKDVGGRPVKAVCYYMQSDGFSLFLDKKGIRYQFYKEDRFHSVFVELLGANSNLTISGLEKQAYEERFMAVVSDKQPTVVSTFKRILYKNVYPNIDWVLYINGNQLEYDFIVHKGGKVSDIQLQYNGADSLSLNADGSLMVKTSIGAVTEHAPVSYTESGDIVKTQYVLNAKVLSYKVEQYSGVLTIDPKLNWATYYGGIEAGPDGRSAVDKDGNVYMVGQTSSLGLSYIATPGVYQTAPTVYHGVPSRRYVGFLVKFDARGDRVWGTYFGGDGSFEITRHSIVCDKEGSVYISGVTGSGYDIATVGSFLQVDPGFYNIYLSKFTKDGALSWATYYGGGEWGCGYALCIDSHNNVLMAGGTDGAASVATPGAHQTEYGNGTRTMDIDGNPDGFIVKFTSEGIRLWGTYYGGAGIDVIYSITCDKDDNIFIAGKTTSGNNIASPGSYKSDYPGYGCDFVARFNNAGVRQWGTYYAGSTINVSGPYSIPSWGNTGNQFLSYPACVCDADGNVYLASSTSLDANIATSGAAQTTLSGAEDAYLARFNGSGALQWCTYIGGSDREMITSLAIDENGFLYPAGNTRSSTGLSTPGSYQETWGGKEDGFFAKFTREGKKMWASYYGGPEHEILHAVVCDQKGHFYLSGYSYSSTGIATSNGFQPENLAAPVAGMNSFLAQFIICAPPKPVIAEDNLTLKTTDYPGYQWLFFGAPVADGNGSSIQPSRNGTYTVKVTDPELCTVESEPYKFLLPIVKLFVPNVFSPNGDTKNDFFKVYGSNVKSFHIAVFNQWGKQVFATSDLAVTWDGRVNGVPQPVGVYAYMLQADFTDGRSIKKNGVISLIR